MARHDEYPLQSLESYPQLERPSRLTAVESGVNIMMILKQKPGATYGFSRVGAGLLHRNGVPTDGDLQPMPED